MIDVINYSSIFQRVFSMCCFGHLFSLDCFYFQSSCLLLQDKATSMQKKIQHLRDKSMKKRSKRTPSLVEPLTGDASKIELYEEKLKRMCDIMHGLQHETMLQQLVSNSFIWSFEIFSNWHQFC